MHQTPSLWLIIILMGNISHAYAGRPSAAPTPAQPSQAPSNNPSSPVPGNTPQSSNPNTPTDQNNTPQPGFLDTTAGQAIAISGTLTAGALVAGGIYLGLKKKHPSTSVSESGTNPQPLVTEEKPLEPELEPEVKTEGAAPAPGKMTGPPKKPLPVPKSKTKPEPEPEAEAEAKTLEEPKPAASQILHPQKLKRIGVWLNHLVSEGIISAKKDFIENRANMLQELKVHTQNNEEFQKHLKTVQPYLAKLSVKNPDDNPTQYAAEIGHDKLIEATAYLRDNVHVNSSLGNVPEHYQYLSQLHDHLVAERDTLLKSVKQEHLT